MNEIIDKSREERINNLELSPDELLMRKEAEENFILHMARKMHEEYRPVFEKLSKT